MVGGTVRRRARRVHQWLSTSRRSNPSPAPCWTRGQEFGML